MKTHSQYLTCSALGAATCQVSSRDSTFILALSLKYQMWWGPHTQASPGLLETAVCCPLPGSYHRNKLQVQLLTTGSSESDACRVFEADPALSCPWTQELRHAEGCLLQPDAMLMTTTAQGQVVGSQGLLWTCRMYTS